MADVSWTVDDAALVPEAWPLEPGQIPEGAPQTSGTVLDSSGDGRVQRGVWQHAPGVPTGIAADGLVVV